MEITDTGYQLTRLLLQRGLGLVYLVGFLVAVNQFRPLLGERGLLPVPRFLERSDFRDSPSVFHLHYSDRFAGVLAWTGVVLSLLAVTGLSEVFGTPVSMVVWGLLWALYLSFMNVGQVFYGFGWESLLVEAGFLAIFLGGAGTEAPEIVIWLFRWLLFRVMLGAGLIKLRGDQCWRDLTCLRWHYETQPLPNPVSWYVHQSPMWVHKAGVAFTHFVQVVVPFFFFAPAPVSWVAGGLALAFQGTLIVTGNFSWLNWLTAVLALSCFDDRILGAVPVLEAGAVAPRGLPHDVAVIVLLTVVALLSIRPVKNFFSERQLMNASFEPLRLVNTYGAFGSVTRERNEIVLEGTPDPDPGPDSEWRPYEFKGKPGDPFRRPPVVAPYHLRLDWQMWFAAMGSYHRSPWLVHLVAKLLEGDEGALGLLAKNPFPDEPPARIRARLFRYRFSDFQEKRKAGRWWSRRFVREYLPALSLDDPGLRQVLIQMGGRTPGDGT